MVFPSAACWSITLSVSFPTKSQFISLSIAASLPHLYKAEIQELHTYTKRSYCKKSTMVPAKTFHHQQTTCFNCLKMTWCSDIKSYGFNVTEKASRRAKTEIEMRIQTDPYVCLIISVSKIYFQFHSVTYPYCISSNFLISSVIPLYHTRVFTFKCSLLEKQKMILVKQRHCNLFSA